MIGKAQPATRMLQEGVSPFFHALAPLGHPVVPDVLGLEVLVDGEEDGVVGGGHPVARPPLLLLLLLGGGGGAAQQLDRRSARQPDQWVRRAGALCPKKPRNWEKRRRRVEAGFLVLHVDLHSHRAEAHLVPSSILNESLLIFVLLLFVVIVIVHLSHCSIFFAKDALFLLWSSQLNLIEVNLG